MRTIVFVFGLVAAASSGCGVGDDEETATRPCEQLRDHLVDLRVEGATGRPDELVQHRAAVKKALGDDFVATCERLMSSNEIACASKASDLASATACQQASTSATH